MKLTIKRKLIFVFLLLLTLLVFSFLFSYLFGEQQRDINSLIMRQQFLINDIYKNLEIAGIQLESYLQQGGIERLRAFEKSYETLYRLSFEFESFPREAAVRRHTIDLKYQIQSFIEEANAAISYQKDGELGLSNLHYKNSIRINSLIRENFQAVFQVVIDDLERMKEHSLKNQQRILGINIGVLLGVVAIYLFLMYEIMRSIVGPIRQLTDAAESVSAGDMEIEPIKIVSDDELKILAVAFNTMIGVIRSQLSELERKRDIESQLHTEELKVQRMNALVNETELKALQAKINPHFLFNTLNIVKQTAYLESAEKTSTLVESFSSMLRYNLDCFDRNVRLEQEVKTLEDYIEIQKTRFAGRISFILDCEESALEVLLPALTIQPIVENAIMHGMKEKLDDGLVEIKIGIASGMLEIVVRDNGTGIGHEKLDAIEMMFQGGGEGLKERTGIGLQNVYQRLHLTFAGRERLRVSSLEGRGSEFRILIPVDLKDVEEYRE